MALINHPPTGVAIQPPQADLINHPPHYTKGRIECLDFIVDQQLPYLAGQVVKYVVRYRHKGTPIDDLKKARFYLDRLITELNDEKTYGPPDATT